MVKHAQISCGQMSTNCLSVIDHFLGSALEGLTHLVNSTERVKNWYMLSPIVFQQNLVKLITGLVKTYHLGQNWLLNSLKLILGGNC